MSTDGQNLPEFVVLPMGVSGQQAEEQQAEEQQGEDDRIKKIYDDTKVWISNLMKIVNDREMLLRLLEVDESTLHKWELNFDKDRDRVSTRKMRLAISKIMSSLNLRPGGKRAICRKEDLEKYLKEYEPLAGGFRKGDRVCIRLNFKMKKDDDDSIFEVKAGEEGIVIGPCCIPEAEDASDRVCVDVGPGMAKVNFLVADQIEHAPLAGGFRKGDRVRSVIDYEPMNVRTGDEGIVVGPCLFTDVPDAADRVNVDMGEGKGEVNFHIHNHIEHVPLLGGYKKGDRVRALVPHASRNIKAGDEGTVLGPSVNSKCDDASDRLCVDWGPDKGWVNFHYLFGIEQKPLPAGFKKGDRVRSLIDCPEAKIKKGYEGKVVGPSYDLRPADADMRVSVDWGYGKGRKNFNVLCIEHAPLAGGFRKGDRVRALHAVHSANVKVGDEGTVVGPCTEEGVKFAEYRVCVDFGPDKKPVNFFAPTHLESARIKKTRKQAKKQQAVHTAGQAHAAGQAHVAEKTKEVLEQLARERAMKQEEADRNAKALIEEIAREEVSRAAKNKRRKALKKLKAGKVAGMDKREAEEGEGEEREECEEREAGTEAGGGEEWEAGTEDVEALIHDMEAGMLLINQRLGLDQAEAGKVEHEQVSPAVEEQVAAGGETCASECCVCLANEKSWIFIPCGHMCVCKGCAHDIMLDSRECPLCRQQTTAIFQVFL
jgi:hypothetical protein